SWGAASSYAFWVQACDTSANCGSSTAKGVYFATTDTGGGDVVTIDISATEVNGWYAGAVDAVATSSAGLIDRYVLDGVEIDVTNAASLTIPVSAPGGHFLLVYDTLGNVGARLLAIDGTPPVANHSINPAPVNGYNAPKVIVSISALDPFGSGVDRIEYSTDDFTTKTSVSGPFASVTVSSTSTVSYRAVDRVGNQSSIVDVTISIDTTAPSVTATAGTGINGGWSPTSPVSVELVATDNEVGTVASTEYSYDGSTWIPYSAQFDVPTEGTTTINVRATDVLGNTGPSPNVVVRIDTLDPTASIASPSGPYAQNAAVPADFTCTDPGTSASGIATCVGSSDLDSSIDTSTVGSFTFTVTATDNAGNVTIEQSSYSVADVTAPVINIVTPTTGGTTTTTVELGTSNVTASYSCFDAADPAPTCLGVVGPEGTIGTTSVASLAALPSTSLGRFTLTVTSTDQAGNSSSTSAVYEVVDTTAPSVGIEIVSDPPPVNGWNAGNVTVTINASDASGTATITYRTSTDGGQTWSPWTDYGGPFQVSSEGTTLIEGSAEDSSNNVAMTAPITVKIDKTAPAISSTVPTSVIVGSTAPTVQFTCADTGGSGVASCTSVPALGTALSTATPGTVSFTVSAVDNVGNASQKTFTVAVKYKVCLLYNANKPQPANGTVAIKVQLCDTSNNNLSNSSIVLTATNVDGAGAIPPQDSGSSNSPTFEFRYDANLAGYIYNLEVSALQPPINAGEHNLNFVVSTTGSAVYVAKFTLK
ncbi:MAG: hypothetical protein JJE47_02365, partial [Acidimicrobiia bacterium]|nr:hypothetical protein [Acidimicrobiia bacterium]